MKTKKEIQKEIRGEEENFERLKMNIWNNFKSMKIDDFDSIIELESNVQNMKNCHNYYDGLKFTLKDSSNVQSKNIETTSLGGKDGK